MNTVEGSIVKATAGKEKGGFFVVIRREGGYAYIADGRRRKVESPKKKSLVHLAPTGAVASDSVRTNPQIRKILNEFSKSEV